MCGHGGVRMVTVSVLNDKGKKTPETYLIDGYENKRDIKTPVGLIGLSKIMNGIQSIIICQPGNVKNQY